MKTVLLVIDAPRFERHLPKLRELAPVVLCDEKPSEVITVRCASKPLDASGSEPKWNLILPMGTYHGETLAPLGGQFTFDADFFNALVANWQANGRFRIPTRWGHEHQRNKDPAKAKDLDRKAANLIDLRVTADGLEGLTDWNASGRRDIASGEFDGWSAEFQMRHVNRLTGEIGGPLLTGVGLTNDPFFNLMPPVAASASAETTDNQPKEQHMEKEALKKWAVSLGLSPDSTIEQCISASNAKLADAEAKVAAAATKPAPATVPAEVIAAAVKPVQDLVVSLQADLKAEKDKGIERDVDAAIEVGKRGDGKQGRAITVELRGFIMATAKGSGLEEAKKLINAIPLSVPITAVGQDGAPADGTVSASAANEKLTAIANELQAKGDKTPMETAMRLNPALTKAVRGLSVSTKSN